MKSVHSKQFRKENQQQLINSQRYCGEVPLTSDQYSGQKTKGKQLIISSTQCRRNQCGGVKGEQRQGDTRIVKQKDDNSAFNNKVFKKTLFHPQPTIRKNTNYNKAIRSTCLCIRFATLNSRSAFWWTGESEGERAVEC
eukprot:TRINITY_DN26517_c0_g1_i1.p1 TRINITY_DN26517_c0_g1~~TRINITY_DN26517_c0_g1_i1.p1  ORF type:complete len:139 (-),score=14.41 TRINITY_DN26517_c0_g1_i1:84-500(-)